MGKIKDILSEIGEWLLIIVMAIGAFIIDLVAADDESKKRRR